jgi:tripeptidyl-peptidase-1
MLFINTLVAALTFVAVSSADKVVFSSPQQLPSGWEVVSNPLDGSHFVSLKMALVPKDVNKLESELLAISTPGSARFRRYLKQAELTDIVGRSDEDISRISKWLSAQNLKIDSIHPNRDWVTVNAKVSQVEKLLECKLAQFSNAKLGKSKIGQ